MNMVELKTALKDFSLLAIARAREALGAERRYCIRGGYTHRTEVCFFDDTPYKDEYQREVYERAAQIALSGDASLVYDVGCGSGYKLMKYLGRYNTVGFDLPPTVAHLREEYPDRQWRSAPFSERGLAQADLVICSDVIEHVLDPDELMAFLLAMTKDYLVLSTPDRLREYPALSRFQIGPPHTDHHVREWTFREFAEYVQQHADVIEHVHSNPNHATQMVVARKRHENQL